MSGICGIAHFDAAPVDREMLRRMAGSMDFRGPDARGEWCGASVAFAHAMLRTTTESGNEVQPLALDGRLWITADARVDDRDGLDRELRAAGPRPPREASDAELILRAYAAWGEACVPRLLGDFAFAIWDAARATLFCARDPFGIKPFFYARHGERVAFANTLDTLRLHAGVTPALDDLAIADFLLFDMLQDPGATAFAAIRRLPPAHCMSVSRQGCRVRRYWEPPRETTVRYRARGDYVAHFNAVFDSAVSDRLRADRVTVSMSGGLDSPAIAAAAKRVLARQGRACELRAHTLVYERLVADSERGFARMAAHALGIPIQYREADGYRLYQGYDRTARRFAEPFHEPEGAASFDLLHEQAAHARVSLMGWDGDALLSESPRPYFRALRNDGDFARLLFGMAGYAVQQRGALARRALAWNWQGRARPAAAPEPFPAWIDAGLVRRLDLHARWNDVHAARPAANALRPYAHGILSLLGRWSGFFDRFDPGVTRLALECRHPFLDLRVVDFCLGLPPHPWCVGKRILRESLKGVVPEAVRQRPKTALGGSPGAEMLKREDARWVDDFIAIDGLERYIERARIPRLWRAGAAGGAWSDLRPLTLNFWLGQNAPTESSLETQP